MEEKYLREKELLERYRKGLCSPAEQLLVDNWFNQQARAMDNDTSPVAADIRNEIWKKLPVAAKQTTVKLWPRIAVAASVALILIAALLFYNTPYSTKFTYKNEVPPGKTGAMLTLADGRKIVLNDAASGQLAEEAGISISKSANGQLVYRLTESPRGDEQNKINTISTAIGETYQVQLSDSSKVWLNAGSALTFASHLDHRGKRRVKLKGEGYFEVAKNKMHPFIVETEGQEIEVLGTHFNVNSYKNEGSVKTTLVEGSVRVRQTAAARNEVVLKPGQQATNNLKDLKVSAVDAKEVLDWKNDGFAFNEGDFAAAMRKIARWYNVEIIYDPAATKKMEIGGFISRKNNLSVVLKFIESTGQVRFTVEGRRVLVKN
ncbi:transmembrane sensor [Pedobacter africanus]|uniref:Ferric-dicitrate binding protein FerR (Iron transport regulator) n=1 Tax=Pedobacter africanus TaxID=151894 RepID=A0ACC6KZ09_9SPHI|nr:FecR domain-containing protein [Pedobacter africanus]MDR6784497.1 ferric-dicitrate binding protein FerR (iron transport regulator) [Pedobacter africanus]